MTPFTQHIQQLYNEIKEKLPLANQKAVYALREKACKDFAEKDFCYYKKENKKIFDTYIAPNLTCQPCLTPPTYRPVEEYFHCKVQNIDTQMFIFLNGWFVHQENPLIISPEGIIIGSLIEAWKQFPELVEPHLTKEFLHQEDSLSFMNRMLFNDGLFVYVPDNVTVQKPIQLISLSDSEHNLLINNCNLIVLGNNAQLSFIQCDDSIQFKQSFINNVTKIHVGENAHFFYYKMENKNPESLLFNEVEVIQSKHSTFTSNSVTFNAGYLRNKINVYLTESFASTKLYGLYLVDKTQHIDNRIFIDHQAPDCESYQLYKGIVDDTANANFLGHVLVRPQAQRTIAAQTNRNITLTNDAHITTKPFLEIYADDVRCSHGATIGQLDEEAMYYLRTRGICAHNARKLLMFAFANEVTNYIDIESLRIRFKEMIEKRLNGELSICDQCLLHCPRNTEIKEFF